MALPAMMKVLGLILGVGLIVFMAFLTDASIELLLRFSKAAKTSFYGGCIWKDLIADSLRFSSALSVALAIVFLVITLGTAMFELISGTIMMPKLLPDVVDLASFWELFTVFPVVVTAYLCHYNGMQVRSARPLAQSNPSIWVAFQFTGATAAVCLGFVFPAAVTLRDRHVISTTKDRILAIVMIVLAVFSNLVAIYSN
ncbi:Transmembrane amino acid transporter family protein isoform 3 [Hibiscus syriacus]|uniref:Transmembrane amino acid transporter family protein isoform 3 n=1 Tax=Hibiscus syriacus TaxID=106335 RepID=A0A6A2Y2T1_HIBSY|nr:Transmembrane amino acid transporter family protein isoform 3 [Hibiscus syriacus]